MTDGQQSDAGTAGDGRPRLVVYEARPTVCEVCRTDQETGVCPADCPARRRRKD